MHPVYGNPIFGKLLGWDGAIEWVCELNCNDSTMLGFRSYIWKVPLGLHELFPAKTPHKLYKLLLLIGIDITLEQVASLLRIFRSNARVTIEVGLLCGV